MDRIAEEFERDGFVVDRGAMSAEEMAPIQDINLNNGASVGRTRIRYA